MNVGIFETLSSKVRYETEGLLLSASHQKSTKEKSFLEKNMTKNLLVELGLEELPAYVVTPSEKQLDMKQKNQNS